MHTTEISTEAILKTLRLLTVAALKENDMKEALHSAPQSVNKNLEKVQVSAWPTTISSDDANQSRMVTNRYQVPF